MRTILRRRLQLATAVLLLVATAAAAVGLLRDGQTGYAAYFPRTTGLYVDDDVKVLGVRVGSVRSIEPKGGQVLVEFTVSASQKVPADVRAAIVAPNLVTSRFIQLTPVYTGGPVLAEGTVIPKSRTAVPVEWDEVQSSVTELATALGPKGANKHGSLNQALVTVDANLHPAADGLGNTITDLSTAADTLAANRGDLFATVRNLQKFVETLDDADESVEAFSSDLEDVAEVLADNRVQLATAVDAMDQAMLEVTDYVQENRATWNKSVRSLTSLSQVLVTQRQDLAQVLHSSPTVVANFYNVIDPVSGAIGRFSVPNLQDLASVACASITSLGGNIDDCRAALAPLVSLLRQLPLPSMVSPNNGGGAAPATSGSAPASSQPLPLPALPLPDLGDPASAPNQEAGGLRGLLGLVQGGSR